ncbi:hypothetical protein KUTeg_001503 [Tegillarca granosa]|uniref:Protein-S-isoprenylcysteine O-methyltransferase n=1 Tax=Tegillarca granosa TaxID=220873 RepID=A0ABQ9FUU1_TEGGR|nr:hypothetical protein KUTeg_001503 [Tegillarca granosa]
MALVRNGKVCLVSFLSAAGIYFTSFIGVFGKTFTFIWEDFWIFILFTYLIIYNGIIFIVYRLMKQEINEYRVAVRGGFLGSVFGLGILLSLSDTTWVHFGWYITALSFFHWSEYFITAVTNPRSLTLESYLLDHSKEYKLAALASWLEFSVEWFIAPGLKQFNYISIIGLLMVISGEVVRKASMITASTNFNHYVQYIKQVDHQLVTRGVYSLCRHPSYVGWFYWSIGTQLILCNPFCLIAYTIVSWRFFRERVYEEEIYLLNFFGEDYLEYQKSVGTGLPFITGYKGEKNIKVLVNSYRLQNQDAQM